MESTFKWNRENTQLIVDEYRLRKERFRNPKQKKKDLWAEIKLVFDGMGYEISVDSLDRKFRNLKKTFTEIKDKHNRTGHSRINWEYFDVFDDIFSDDRAINSNITLSSINSNDELGEVLAVAEISVCSSAMQTRKRALKDYREQSLEIERAKLAKMDRLIDNIEKNTRVHEERNNLLKQIIDLNNPL